MSGGVGPGQEFADTAGGMVGDAGDHVGEPGFGIAMHSAMAEAALSGDLELQGGAAFERA